MNKEGADQTGLIRRKVFLRWGQTFWGAGALKQNVLIVFIFKTYFNFILIEMIILIYIQPTVQLNKNAFSECSI